MKLLVPHKCAPEMTHFVPVQMHHHQCESLAHTVNGHGSGDHFSLLLSDGIVEVPPCAKDFDKTELVNFFPWGRQGG